jgi:hypothetical protein
LGIENVQSQGLAELYDPRRIIEFDGAINGAETNRMNPPVGLTEGNEIRGFGKIADYAYDLDRKAT